MGADLRFKILEIEYTFFKLDCIREQSKKVTVNYLKGIKVIRLNSK